MPKYTPRIAPTSRVEERLAAPVDIVGCGGLAAGGTHQRGNLAAVIPRVSEKLGEYLVEPVAKSAGVQALVFDQSIKIWTGKACEIFGPEFLNIREVRHHRGEIRLVRKHRTGIRRDHAQPLEPDPSSHGQMSEPADGFLILR